MKIDKNTFIVFDLDDTLYKEFKYVKSGYSELSVLVYSLYGVKLQEEINAWHNSGQDVLQNLCLELKLPDTVKQSFLWAYRLHSPNIDNNIKSLLVNVHEKCSGIAILTDGRSVSQRLKLKSLGLLEFPVYISEEWASEKPSEERFLSIESDFRNAKKFVYVGDNVKKDFLPANNLGWTTIGLLDIEKVNIHPQNSEIVGTNAPDMWVSSLDKISEMIC